MRSHNPLPEIEILLGDLPPSQQIEGLWLLENLMTGQIPSRPPIINTPHLRAIVTSFRMWAFIHKRMVKSLALAMSYEFGPFDRLEVRCTPSTLCLL